MAAVAAVVATAAMVVAGVVATAAGMAVVAMAAAVHRAVVADDRVRPLQPDHPKAACRVL